MTTGEKISKLRKEKGLKQEELAERLGVTRQAVSRWESDLAFPETDKLVTMSKLFNCSVDYLLKYDEPERGERPTAFDLRNWHYEYKSKKTVGGVPLVHVNIGLGRTAKGIFAVGINSVGVFSVGILSLGIFAFGILALGLFALASLSLGLILGAGAVALGVLSFGGVAVGVISFGGLSVGLLAYGGCAVGGYAFGGAACGSYIAIGDVARGGIALGGKSASGSVISATVARFEELKPQIYSAFDTLPPALKPLTNLFKNIFESILRGEITLG